MNARTRFAIAVSVLLGWAAAAEAGDFVQKKDGTFNPAPKSGAESPTAADYEESTWQIADATIQEVRYALTLNGKPIPGLQKFPSADVLEIWLEPRDYGSAWKDASDAMASGNYAQAAAMFRAVAGQQGTHPVVRQKALLNVARALGAGGDAASVKAAEAAYDALLKDFPQTFYLRALWKDRWQLRMDGSDYDGAKQAIAELNKLPGVSDGDRMESDLATNSIDLREAAAKKDQAAIQRCLDKFKEISGKTAGQAKFASAFAQAKVGQGTCLLELGNASEAKGIFEEMAEKAKEAPVVAAAYNGLGECWMRQSDKAGWTEARRCFLRTQLLYTEGTSPDLIAKALYYTGDCFNRLQDTDDWKDRARRELSDCIRRFKTSPWAEKAKRLLNAIPK